jgi:hypothetical protein
VGRPHSRLKGIKYRLYISLLVESGKSAFEFATEVSRNSLTYRVAPPRHEASRI